MQVNKVQAKPPEAGSTWDMKQATQQPGCMEKESE